jgi:hypothetical protein
MTFSRHSALALPRPTTGDVAIAMDVVSDVVYIM